MNDHLNEQPGGYKSFEMNDRNSREYKSNESPNISQERFSLVELSLETTRNKIKKHFQEKNKIKRENSKKMIWLFCINFFILICARDLPTSFHQIARIKKENSRLSYLGFVEYDLIYWIPNMFLPLILGFISDYAANIGSVNILLITMQFPLLLSQLLIIIKKDTKEEGFYESRLASRVLFSFSGETLFIMFLSLLTDWFKFTETKKIEISSQIRPKETIETTKPKQQIDYLCSYLFWGFIASAFVNMIVVVFCCYYNETQIQHYSDDFTFFLVINIVLVVGVSFTIIINYFSFQTFLTSDKQFFEELDDEKKKRKISYETAVRSRSNSTNQKKNLNEKNPFPTSFCDALTSKILTFRFFMIGFINSILYGCMFFFQDIVINFLFCDASGFKNQSKSPENIDYIHNNNEINEMQDNPLLNLEYYRNSNFLLILINLLKSLITIIFIPNFIKRTGNRNFLMTLAIIFYLFAFSILSYYFHAMHISEDEIFYFLRYFIIAIASSAICIGSALQMNSFVSYIPILIEENLYVTAYGFFASLQSIFIVFLHLITNFLIIKDEQINLSHIVDTIGVILIFLILSFIIIIILEFKYYKDLYSKQPLENEFLKQFENDDPKQQNVMKSEAEVKNN